MEFSKGEYFVSENDSVTKYDTRLNFYVKLCKEKLCFIKKSIKNFHGVKRRFELINKIKNCLVIHDYAHHPTEIYNTINQAKLYGKVLTVFQPHTFSRTKSLLQQFINSFDKTDGLILLKTYPARQTETPKSSAEYLYNEIIRNNKLFTNYYSTNLIIKKNNQKLKIKIPIYLKLYFKKNRNIRKLIPIIYLKDFFIAKEIIMQNINKYDCILILGAGDIDQLANLFKN